MIKECEIMLEQAKENKNEVKSDMVEVRYKNKN